MVARLGELGRLLLRLLARRPERGDVPFELVARAPARDGDAGEVRRDVDQLALGAGRAARLAVVHRERAEHLPLAGEDRSRPAGP